MDASTESIVSMTQVVFCSALGFMMGQGVLRGAVQLIGWLQSDSFRSRIQAPIPLRGTVLIAGFIKYAGVLGALGALIALGTWTAGDYLAARAAHGMAKAHVVAPSNAVPASAPDETAGVSHEPEEESSTSAAAGETDPYSDAEFKVQRPAHRRGAKLTLKETLLQRSEERARADLLKQMQQHMTRSQYDCEAADRAGKYLAADLDVWGFATWQVKYFPTDRYAGATLPQCKDIKNIVDPSVQLAVNSRR